ncbi:MAG: T9SS type A sorting domain-containing protein [Crocinitomicaceae bacterium]|nr:T9SS type A sorting domain-containing protein [Crocinitomicaceae bacterium]
MKKFSLLLLVSLLTQLSIAQNMIPNPDWEIGPVDSSDPFTGWNSNGSPNEWAPIATPDRIVYGSPAISRDGHPPYSGNAYCVFYGPQFSEGGRCALTYPIETGKTYCLSAWLDVDDNFDNGPGRMQFMFDTDTINTPFVTNAGDWQFFDTTFTATGYSDSLYLFADGENLMKIDYMIMDTVGCSSGQAATIQEQTENIFSVFTNTANNELILSLNEIPTTPIQIAVYDILGRETYSFVIPAGVLSHNINTAKITPGVHVIMMSYLGKEYSHKVFIE